MSLKLKSEYHVNATAKWPSNGRLGKFRLAPCPGWLAIIFVFATGVAPWTGVFFAYLGVTVELSGEMRVVEEQLQSLLRVVVAQVMESGAAAAAARLWILKAGRVHGDDRRDGVRRRRNGSIDR